MKNFGRTSAGEFLGDRVVYRNLIPVDKRLPPLNVFRDAAGLPPGKIPRKSEPDYAKAIVYLLWQARALESAASRIRRLIFIGDTRLNDGAAFTNICRAANWPGLAFIGSETDAPPAVETAPAGAGQTLYLANRWAALADFDRFCARQGFVIDDSTAVIVDLDKTALGARGRNAHTIDRARLLAVRRTVAGLLGSAFDRAAFEAAYEQLNRVEFHPFTRDNQDYLAYICLILGSGLFEAEQVIAGVRAGQLTTVEAFMARVDRRVDALEPALAEIHRDIYALVLAGDPTPFKPFRRNEYLSTVERMGHLPDDAPVETLLAEEILITQEVRALALDWRRRGALLFGLSDKPDEASIPTPELAARGYQPIHRAESHAIGRAG